MYTAIFVVLIGGMVIGQFKLGYTIVGMGDSVWQHLPIMGYLQARLHGAGFANPLATWDWHLGLGTDVFQNLSYYVLGDPLAYIIGLFPANHLLMGYEFIQFLRFYLAGLSFMFLVSHYRFTPVKSLLATMIYLFSAFGVWAFEFQPFFVNALILLPLLIWAVERALQLKKFGWLSAIVAITLINNFYLALILGLGTVAYTVVVYFFRYRIAGKADIQLWLRLVGSAVVGVLMSAIMLVPVLTFMLNSGRVGSGITAAGWLFPLKYYFNLTMSMTGFASGGLYFWMPFYWIPVIGIVIAWVFTNFKKYRVAGVLFIVAIVSALSPITTSIWNGTANPSDRWMFLVNALVAVLFIFVLDDLKQATGRQIQKFLLVYIIMFLVGMSAALVSGQVTVTTFILSGFAAIILALLVGQRFMVKPQHIGRYLLGVFTILIAMQMGIHLFLPGYHFWNGRLTVKNSLMTTVKNPTQYNKYLKKHLQDGEHAAFASGFKYAGGTNTVRNDLIARNNTINTYFSTQLPGLTTIGRDMGITDFAFTRPIGSLDNRQILFDTLGVKYVATNVGRNARLSGFRVVRKNAANRLIMNPNAMAMAYVQKNVVPANEFDRLSGSGKELAYAQVAATGQVKATTTLATAMQVKPVELPYTVSGHGVTLQGNKMTIDSISGSGKTVLRLDTSKLMKKRHYEYHLEVTQPAFTEATISQQIRKSNTNLKADSGAFKRGILTNRVQKQDDIQRILLNTDTSYSLHASGVKLKHIKLRQPGIESLSGYSEFKSFVGNFGTQKLAPQQINLKLTKMGVFTGTVRVVAVPVGEPFTKVVAANNHHAIHNLRLTPNRLRGNITAKKGAVLVTTIPYSDGWVANVGGNTAKIVKVNNAFIGVKLTQTGNVAVNLRYQTPNLRLGVIISLVTLIAFSGFQLVMLWVRRRTGSKKLIFNAKRITWK